MSNDKTVSNHYAHGSLLNAIQAAIAKLGKTVDRVTIEDLAPVDEFHIGGRLATEHFLEQLNFNGQKHVLDVGCGLGGAARFAASKYHSTVTGIDITEEYIDTGNALCEWVSLGESITLKKESALSMSFQDEAFDGGYMMHVGMNIEDKMTLFTEIYRVLKPGALFGVYDIMRIDDGELAYPVPWAEQDSTSMLAKPNRYRQALVDAGFEVSKENNRRDFALDFFQKTRARTEANGGPPPLGLHTLMQESTAVKLNNMVNGIASNNIAPVEIIAKK